MKNRIRIFFIGFVLLGGTAFFGYWSINQFNQAFDDLHAFYQANINLAYQSLDRADTEVASTSPDASLESATSTDSELVSGTPELSFVFPQKDTDLYIGCTYPITWHSSTIIHSLEAALIDAGTREPVGPKTGGLAAENIIETESQSLDWKVGFVWPGAYSIKISKINDIETEAKSKIFIINKMPQGIGADEREEICKKSGGSF